MNNEYGDIDDYEDMPRFWAGQEQEKRIIQNELEEEMRNDPRN